MDARLDQGENVEDNPEENMVSRSKTYTSDFFIKNREIHQTIAERIGSSDTRMIDNYVHIRPNIQIDVSETFGNFFFEEGT